MSVFRIHVEITQNVLTELAGIYASVVQDIREGCAKVVSMIRLLIDNTFNM